jgi:hypothetical protein
MAADETDYLDGGVGGRYSLNFRTMDIHITRNGEQHNTYPEATARQFLEEGKLLSTDLACYAGADGWKPLSEVLEVSAQPSATTSPNTPDVQKMITDKETGARKGNDLNRASRSDMPAPWLPVALPNASDDDLIPGFDLDPHSQHIYITRDGKEFGPYDADRIRGELQQRRLLPSDYAWFEGLSDWTPLSEIIAAIPEPAVSRQPWCGKCKSYTEYINKTTFSRGGGGGTSDTCKVCGSNMFTPAKYLYLLKVGGVIFLISVVAIPCMLFASANSWRVALLLEMVDLQKPCVIVAVLSPLFALFIAYEYLKWYAWKRKCATDLHR